MFNPNPNAGDNLVLCLLCHRQFLAFRLLFGLIDRDARWLVALKPCILEEVDLRWEYQLFDVTDAFVMDTTGISLTEVPYQALFDVDDEIVFERMLFFDRCTDPSAQSHRVDVGPGARCHR